VVEVNRTWGVLARINVRATQHTYDNASFIIPNSEFISKQVTNWSFKELRLRRIITVGVAYGSDVELVRENTSGSGRQSSKGL
jgi:small-conductance mechanosensitive channel